MPFWRRRFSSSGSEVGGRQVLPEQTRALGLSLGRCGSVWRRAAGKYSSEVAGVTRRTDLPKRKTSLAARSSFFEGEVHGALGGAEIFCVEGGFVSIEERQHAENLVVERAAQSRAADAVRKAVFLAPGFAQHAIDRFQGKGARI